MPFDLLYWNADTTRMPAAMHSYYLRNMYQKNLLVQPGGITLDGVPIDLRKVAMPGLHPGRQGGPHRAVASVYKRDARSSRGPVRFVLAGSGHIAGVINPPRRRSTSTGQRDGTSTRATLEEWRAGATEHPGLVVARLGPGCRRSPAQVPARVPGAAACRRSRTRPAAT